VKCRHHFSALRGAAEADERIKRGDILVARRPATPPRPSKKNCTAVSNKRQSSWSVPPEMRFVPFSYFCSCWKVTTEGFRHLCLALAGLQPSGTKSRAEVLIDNAGLSWRVGNNLRSVG
jgi:hypothetical protein